MFNRPAQTPNSPSARGGSPPKFTMASELFRGAQQQNKNAIDASKIKFVPLPFYEIKQCIVNQSRLEPDFKGPNQGMSQKLQPFTLTEDVMNKLLCKGDASLPKHELQMRIVSFDTSTEQVDKPPATLYITMNNQGVILPAATKANVQGSGPVAKRAQLPINLTSNISKTTQRQLIEIKWEDKPKEPLAYGIWLVEHLNSDILHQKFMEKGQKRSIEETQKLINKSFDDGDGIATDSLKIPLKCPLTQSVMAVPVRSLNCSHLICFDLRNYLKLNEVKTKWQCPVCSKSAPYDTLELDLYFADLIKQAGDASEIEFFPKNRWEFVGTEKDVQKQVVAIEYEEIPDSSSGNDQVSSQQSGQLESAKGRKSAELVLGTLWQNIMRALSPALQGNVEIITLDDSDEEDNAKESNPSPSRKRRHEQITTDPNRITIITLDEDD